MGCKDYLLQRLIATEEYIPLSDLMKELQGSRRSVYRYINELNYMLSYYNISVENAYGKGVKLIGNKRNLPARMPARKMDFSDFTPWQRRMAELTLLCVSFQSVKLSAIGDIFGVSESCISLDMSIITKNFLKKKELEHLKLCETLGHKGKLVEASLWYRRMSELYCSLSIFPVEEIGEQLMAKRENPYLEKLKTVLGLKIKHKDVLACLEEAERMMACSFTLFDYVILYFYICYMIASPITVPCSKKTAGKTAEKVAGFAFNIEPIVPQHIAANILKKVDQDNPAEIFLMQCLLSALEPVKLSEKPFLNEKILPVLTEMERTLKKDQLIDSVFNKDLSQTLQVQLNSILYKKIYQIPGNIRDYSKSMPVERIGTSILNTLNPLLKDSYGIVLDNTDIEPLRISIRTTAEKKRQTLTGIRVLVLCYEGMCLSRLIAAELHIFFPEIEIVDITGAITLTERYLKQNHIDLLVTTVSLKTEEIGDVPCFKVPVPFNRISLIQAFGKYIETHPFEQNRYTEEIFPSLLDNPTAMSVHKIFKTFSIFEVDKPLKDNKITAKLASLIVEDIDARKELQLAFDLREKKGHVYLQVENIQLFHCRSDCVSFAQAGLIRSKDHTSVILYLVAPVKATKEELLALSLISSALIESDDFADSLHEKSASEIEQDLLALIA